MDRPEKVAMPEATVTAEPPLRVPPPGLVPMARLTCGGVVRGLDVAVGVLDRHRHGRASWSAPAAVLEGPWTKASLAGGPTPALMLKAAEVAAVYDGVLEAVSV